MKKSKLLKFLFVGIISIPFLTGCQDLSLKEENKTSYRVEELAKIDHFQIMLKEATFKDEYLHLTASDGNKIMLLSFKIKNTSKNSANINSNSFSLLIDNKPYSPVSSENMSIPSNEEITYELIYEVPIKDKYSLIFYSGVVTNNASFEIIVK